MILTLFCSAVALVFLLMQMVESLVDSKAADVVVCDRSGELCRAAACVDDGAAVVQSKHLLHTRHVSSVFEER